VVKEVISGEAELKLLVSEFPKVKFLNTETSVLKKPWPCQGGKDVGALLAGVANGEKQAPLIY